MFAIGYRNSATGDISFYFAGTQQHTLGDLTNGSPYGSYSSGKIFDSLDNAETALAETSQGWEIVSVPPLLHGNPVVVQGGQFYESAPTEV